MLCPVPAQFGIPCHHGPQKSPQVGTVPGIKKHVLFAHGREIYEKTVFPPTYPS